MRKAFVYFKLLCAASILSVSVPTMFPHIAEAFTSRNLMYGSQGYDVNELEGRLRLLGYYWGKNDGIFGWKTYWSVRTFQYNFGLPVTGEVNLTTKQKLVQATPNWHSTGAKHSSSNNSTATQQQSSSVQAAASTTSSFSGNTGGFSESDLNLMAHVVYGEARGESLEGQVAIAAVILNRLHSNKFPNTIPSIIYHPGAFTAVSDGQVNLTPNSEAKKAVVEAVKGYDPTHGATFYFNPAKTNNAWMWSRPEILTIGHHIFTN